MRVPPAEEDHHRDTEARRRGIHFTTEDTERTESLISFFRALRALRGSRKGFLLSVPLCLCGDKSFQNTSRNFPKLSTCRNRPFPASGRTSPRSSIQVL